MTEFKVVMHVRTDDPLIDERELRHLIEGGLSKLTISQLDVQVWETDETDEDGA